MTNRVYFSYKSASLILIEGSGVGTWSQDYAEAGEECYLLVGSSWLIASYRILNHQPRGETAQNGLGPPLLLDN